MLKEHNEIGLSVRITSHVGVKVTVAHAVIESAGTHAKLFFYFRPKGSLLNNGRTISICNLFGFQSDIHL